MTNLTEQDLRRIETIENKLAELDELGFNKELSPMWQFLCRHDVSQAIVKMFGGQMKPIDTTEGEQEQGKEVAPIETEQRWKPKRGEEVYAANNNPLKFIFTNQVWHLVMYEAGMLFRTEEEAIRHYVYVLVVNSKKEAIKQYLSTNKF